MSKIKNSIFKSAFFVSVMMLCFKLIAFIKQAVVAYYFGATAATDVYFVAFGFISGIGQAIVGALNVSLVAVYTTTIIRKGEEKAKELLGAVLRVMLPLFLLLIVIFVGLADLFSSLLAPSYSGEQALLLSRYIRILAPVLLFCMLEFVLKAVLDSHKSFFIPRLQSLIYSLSVISASVLLSGKLGVNALIIGHYASYIILISILIIATRSYISFVAVKLKNIPELKEIVLTSIPLFIGNSALQINQIVDKSIASGLGLGVISALYYCHILEQFITNIMVVNIGDILFANFASLVAKHDLEAVGITLKKAINILICILIAISCVTIMEAKDIVTIVYFRGKFSFNAVLLTASALVGYAISFVAVAVRDLTAKSLYAFSDTKKPMITSLISIGINIALSLFLSQYMGIFGIALATSISAIVGMLLNVKFLKNYLKEYMFKDHFFVVLKLIPASAVLIIVCFLVHNLAIQNALARFALVCGIGFPVYFLIIYFMHIGNIFNQK